MKTASVRNAPNGVSVSEEELERMVGRDPHRPGSGRWRLLAEQVPIWAMIGDLKARGMVDPADVSRETVDEIARDYDISPTAVLAALHYYEHHPNGIDAPLEANSAALE